MNKSNKNNKSYINQSGNIFTVLIGAVALIGIISITSMNMLSGPVATSSRVMQKTMADSQMFSNNKIVILSATNQANNGDCEAVPDGFIEPEPWRAAGGNGPDGVVGSNGGGFIPNTLGLTTTDPWGSEYGYCVWDVGTVDDAGCGGVAQLRLAGSPTPTVDDLNTQYVLALISAGQDRIFQTQCKDYVNGTTAILVPAGDDIVQPYTYADASASTSSLWSIKTSDATTATIDKKIDLDQGLKLGSATEVTVCGAGDAELMRYNPISGEIEVCDGVSAWDPLNGDASAFNDDNTVVCDGTTIGQLRYNTTTSLPEFCDGTDWRAFTFSAASVELVLTPANSSGMNNVGPCSSDCPDVLGTEIAFTLQNVGTATSAAVSYSITGDTANFIDQPTSDCNTMVLTPNDTCTIRIVPSVDGNYTYSGTINILTDNMPIATMSGTGSGFGCFPGSQGPGGIYVACSLGGGVYDLISMPGGCDGTMTPVCDGSIDDASVIMDWGSYGRFELAESLSAGTQNHVNLLQYQSSGAGSFTAMSYCDNMTYEGYTDWYLPSVNEMRFNVYPNKVAIGGFSTAAAGGYHSSSSWPGLVLETRIARMNDAGIAGVNRSNTYPVRCLRREGQALPAAALDTSPDDLALNLTEVLYVSGGRRGSAIKTINSISTSIPVSVSGTGSPTFRLNGGGEITSGTANAADTIQLVIDVPAVAGDKNTVTLTIGPDSYIWSVAYANPALTRRIFVTSNTYQGNLGGLSGADSKCQMAADSDFGQLGGTWKAVISGSSPVNSAIDRIPFNWGTLINMNGDTVANNFTNLWTGSLINPVLYDESGTSLGASRVWTGSISDGSVDLSGDGSERHCYNWVSTNPYYDGRYGLSSSIGGGWMTTGSRDCDEYYRLYCAEVDPLPAYVPPVNPKSCTQAQALNILPVGGSLGVDEGITGTYIIDPDDTGPLGTMQVHCDMDTSGGPWMLVLNYVHQGTTNPALSASGTTFPLLGSTTLGDDESGVPANWGHATPALINVFYDNGTFSRARFQCETSRHARKMDFYTEATNCIFYLRFGTVAWDECRDVNSGSVSLFGHSANLPNTADSNAQNQGSNTLTEIPFYDNGVGYWAVGAQTDEWACDGNNNTDATYHTIHKVWIK